jgi:thiamine biosynthesis lipoprotein
LERVFLADRAFGREPGIMRASAAATMSLLDRSWSGRVMGTRARLLVVTEVAREGDEALHRAVRDLEETEMSLSRFRPESELCRLNRRGTLLAGRRLLEALQAAALAYEWSGGTLDPRVIGALEGFGYRKSLPEGEIPSASVPVPLEPVDMRTWINGNTGRIKLPLGVRLDLAGVGKALGIGWAAQQLAGHSGFLVDVGGDIIALGGDERGQPLRVAVDHGGFVGEFAGNSLAVATSTTTRRAWKAGGLDVHHLIDPRTGAPSQSDLLYATVAAPTILEADLTAKLLIIEGRKAAERLNPGYQIVVTDRDGRTEVLETKPEGSGQWSHCS